MNIEEAKTIFEKLVETNRHREAREGLMEGERQHAHNVLGWVNKLESAASFELQTAALFHDVDRVINPAYSTGSKYDRHSQEYFQHKKAHAKRSATITSEVLLENGVSKTMADRINFLISHHDDVEQEVLACNDKELDVLVAADSLAYFDNFAIRMLNEVGVDQVTGKIKFMISKMPKRYREILKSTKLENETIEKIKNNTLNELNP